MTVAVSLCPTFGVGFQAFTTGGLPLNAGLLYSYIAGGTTPQSTYTTSGGSTTNANPIVLDADGRVPGEIWLITGNSYRFDLYDSASNLIKSYDNISGINDFSSLYTQAPTYLTSVSGTNTITASVTPTPTLTVGQRFFGLAAATNTGAVTLNISGTGAGAVQWQRSALKGGELVINMPFAVQVTAATPVFEIVSPLNIIRPNSQSAAYTTVLADMGGLIQHPTTDNNARTFTIDSNANVPYPVGTPISFWNGINTLTIAITSDTMTLAGSSSTGSRTLAANGIATAVKTGTTTWNISGTGLT